MTKTISLHKQIFDYLDERYAEYKLHPRDVFFNHRKEGLRLTNGGFAMLKDQDFEYTRFRIEDDFQVNTKVILKLDRNMIWPYYITKKTLYLFGDEDAATLKLVGSVASWVDCLG